MRARQKNLRIFELEIENEEGFFIFFEKNRVLLQEYLLVLKGDTTDKIREYLKSERFCFVEGGECSLNLKESAPRAQKDEQEGSAEPKPAETGGTLCIQRTIRSGEEISADSDIVLFGRINSGARIIGHKNVMAFGEIDGVVECNGDFMIIKKIAHGNIIFKGELLDKALFDDNIPKKVSIINDILEIKEI